MNSKDIHTGQHGCFYWMTLSDDYSGDILRLCPEVMLGRYLAVTSIDGGIMQASESQQAAGWEVRQDIGYSPKLDHLRDVPHQLDGPDGPGYDEFYTFENPCDLGERRRGNIFQEEFAPSPGKTAVFVAWASFVLHRVDGQALTDLFWPQLLRLNPESYVADGTSCLTFVTRNKKVFDTVHDRLGQSH